jgi:hypothetical protein
MRLGVAVLSTVVVIGSLLCTLAGCERRIVAPNQTPPVQGQPTNLEATLTAPPGAAPGGAAPGGAAPQPSATAPNKDKQ